MSGTIWRVIWNLAGTNGPRQSMEFTAEDNAMGWAEGLLKGGANGIFVTELVEGRTIRIQASSDPTQDLFSQK